MTRWFRLLTVAALVYAAYWAGRSDWTAVEGVGVVWVSLGIAVASERLLGAYRASRRIRERP